MTDQGAIVKAVAATILPNVGGWIGSIAVKNNYKTWYSTLNKPSWTPPSAAFAPVWTSLYSGMGYASYLVWRDGGGFDGQGKVALGLYASQLALNWAWTPIFFAYHSPKWALMEITLLGATASYCAVEFYKVNQTAGLIMVPYLAWLALASCLNCYIYRHNKIEDKKE